MQSRLPVIVATFGQRAAADLGLPQVAVAGLFGNGDVESDGFNARGEYKPIVAGSRGGLSWMQWTGPRRRAFEAWCAANGLDPYSDRGYDEAAYRFMVHELQGAEASALRALRACTTVDQAATVVCTKYLRPGIPHLDKRLASARRAYALLTTGVGPAPAVASDVPAVPKPAPGRWSEDALPAFEVRAIQQRLVDLGYHIVGLADGKWGERTTAAVKALQEQATASNPAIVADGHYGPQTRALLADDANRARIAPARANITAKDLAAVGNPGVVTGRKITFASVASILSALGAFGVALAQGWTTNPDLPFPLNLAVGFLPPGTLPLLIVAFNVYTAAKSTGLIGAAVERVREGIDNSGAPQSGPITLPFGLDKLIPR